MKKVLAVFLLLSLLLPVIAVEADEYSPALEMSMDDFILKYNAVNAPLGSPYVLLKTPKQWTEWNEYYVAWFSANSDNSVTILLMTKDKTAGKSTAAGLDLIQIFGNTESDLLALCSVTCRCCDLFSTEIFGSNLSAYYVGDTIRYYYESNAKNQGYTSYRTIDTDEKYALSFFNADQYYFMISTLEDAK